MYFSGTVSLQNNFDVVFTYPKVYVSNIFLGLSVPIIIPFQFENFSSLQLKYEVNMTKFKALNKNDVQNGIVSIENPNGIVQGNQKKNIFLSFLPIETKTYAYKFYLKIYRGQKFIKKISQTVSLKTIAGGSPLNFCLNDTKEDTSLMKNSQIEAEYSSLSTEFIDFYFLQPQISYQTFVILMNHSKEKYLDFKTNDIEIDS